jgi:hypothetical protein
MNIRESQARRLTEIYWSGTVLNVYTISLMLITPFWGAALLSSGHIIVFIVLLILLAGMIGLSFVDKPMLAYDPGKRLFYSPEGDQIRLEDIAMIELDARDIYFIPKTQGIKGWHLHTKGWTLTPRQVMFTLAKQHHWPIKDIAHPFSRYGFWIIP